MEAELHIIYQPEHTSLGPISIIIVVTAQQQPQPNNKTTITVVGLRQSNRWDTTTHQQKHPQSPTINSKLHDSAEMEQNSENKSH